MKTASSYLQRCWHDRRADLEWRGVHYASELSTAGAPHVHHPLYFAARARDPDGAMRQRLAALSSAGHKHLLISSEFLTGLGPPGVTFLAGLLGPRAEVEVVYVCRRWSDRLFSHWFNAVQTGRTETLPAHTTRLLSAPMQSRDINYVVTWRHWAQVFGRDNIRIVPSSSITDAKQDLFERFSADILGLPGMPPPAQLGRRVNASGDGIEGEIVRALNALCVADGGTPHTAMLFGFWRHRKQADLAPLLDKLKPFERRFTLDDKDPRLDPAFDALRRWLDRFALPAGMAAEPFTRRARDITVLDPAWTAHPPIAAMLRDMYEAIRKAPSAAPPPGMELPDPDQGEEAA